MKEDVKTMIKNTKNEKNNKIRQEFGFTLVEILVVVSVVLLSVGIVGDLIVSIVRSYNKTRILNEIEQNGNYALAKINYALRNATAVASTGIPLCSTNGTNPYIDITDNSGTVTTYTFENVSVTCGSTSVNVPSLTRSVGGGADEPVTNTDCKEGVEVNTSTSYGFCVASGTVLAPTSIRVAFTLKQAPSAPNSKASQASLPFSTVVGLRLLN